MTYKQPIKQILGSLLLLQIVSFGEVIINEISTTCDKIWKVQNSSKFTEMCKLENVEKKTENFTFEAVPKM